MRTCHADQCASNRSRVSSVRNSLVACVLLVSLASVVRGRDWRPQQIPNGSVNDCSNCHLSPVGGDSRNPFGEAVEALVSIAGMEQFWSETLAQEDSDGDGIPNGVELQDPAGTWRPGMPQPGDPARVSNPGDPESVPPPECYFEDDFSDMSNWDQPVANAGLDFMSCDPGIPVALDIGSVDVAGGKLLFTPGDQDLGFGTGIALTGMTVDAAASFVGRESYRVRFDVLAQGVEDGNGDPIQGGGLIQGAFFIGQHYFFDTGTNLFDSGETTGLGFTLSFDCPHSFDGECDHIHPYHEGPCLAESFEPERGPGSADLDGFLTERDTPYTIIMDADGDDHEGPLTLQVKLFPAGEPEPDRYTGSWQLELGLPVADEPDLDHGVLIAALGSSASSLEVSDFSVCEIPLADRYVRFVQCERLVDGAVSVRWDNPYDAAGEEITIAVNGEDVGTANGIDTEFVIEDPPAGDLTISITNYSGVAATCTLCENDQPESVIEGPTAATLEEAMAGLAFDGSGSSDPEGSPLGPLVYFWEVVTQPDGAQATIVDPFVPAITLTADTEGEYVLRLTVTDSGCDGDPLILDGSSEVTLRVGPTGIGPFIRGDCAQKGEVNLTSGIFTLNFLFLGGTTPPCRAACDSNADGSIDLTTAVYTFNFLFLGGPPPPAPAGVCGFSTLETDVAHGCETPLACAGG